jgi:two-component system, cell cycle sensor histidine kinase and response regulator CckA
MLDSAGKPESTTVLLAENEASARTVLLTILDRAGYSMIVAENGREALDLARKYYSVIHLLLTNFRMPGITGTELARQIRLERPNIKVMLISGYLEDNIEIVHQEGFAFLQRPFPQALLLQHISELLSGGSDSQSSF